MEVSFLSRGAGSSSAFPDRPLRARFSEFVTSCTRVVAGTPVRRRNQRNDGYGIGNDIRARIRTPSRRRSEHATAGRAQTHTPGTDQDADPHPGLCITARAMSRVTLPPVRVCDRHARPHSTDDRDVRHPTTSQTTPKNSHLPTIISPQSLHRTKRRRRSQAP